MTMSSGGRISEHLSIGVLAWKYPLEQIRRILGEAGLSSQRVRDLPADAMIYYVIALGLFMAVSTREVLRCLVEGLQWLGADGVRVAGKSAISQARHRLGAAPFKALWEASSQPMASESEPGAFYRGLRLVAIDGSTLDVPDTADNLRHFGKQQSSRGESAFPQMRLAAMVECGPHAILAIRHGVHSDSEDALSSDLFKELRAGQLCLGDRLYATYPLYSKAQASGAHLLWRARANLVLEPETVFEDGSYLSELYPSPKDRRKKTGGIIVRVIEYEMEGVKDAEPLYRLLTTLLDPAQAPAAELAALYAQRWEIEGTLDELKTHLRGGQIVLRSKTPDLVEQELYGLLLAHRAVRSLMKEAAASARADPDTISFVHSVRVVRRKLVAMPALPP
jgi:hypothetical protein